MFNCLEHQPERDGMPNLTLTVNHRCKLGARFLEVGDTIVIRPDGTSWIAVRAGQPFEISDLLDGGLVSVEGGDVSLLPQPQTRPRLTLVS